MTPKYSLGIDIGSTTVKIAILDQEYKVLFSDYERHLAHIQETLAELLQRAKASLGSVTLHPVITGSGGLTLSKHLQVPFVQEVVAVAASLQDFAPQTDVAIELGGEDAKIIYFTGGVDQRMNGICAGGTGSFIDQMAALLQTDASGLNEYAKNYKAIYPIAARCGVFAKSDIQPLINEGATREDLSASIFQAVVNRPSAAWPAASRSAETWLFSEDRFISLGVADRFHSDPSPLRRAGDRSGPLPPLRCHRRGDEQSGHGGGDRRDDPPPDRRDPDGFRGKADGTAVCR